MACGGGKEQMVEQPAMACGGGKQQMAEETAPPAE
jgi:hypothetical protein